jgi:peptide/nickel transport system permease protein
LFIAVAAPWLAPWDPSERVAAPFTRPCAEHPLGTNDIGQDILSEIIYGARVSLTVGLLAALVATLGGTLIGIACGYLRGGVDTVFMNIANTLMCLPGLPMTMVFVAYLGGGIKNIILIICLTGWTGTARVVRARVMSLREEPYILLAPMIGANPWRIIRVHLLPNVARIALTRFSMSVGSAIMMESSLSFLGMGVVGQKSWGSILQFAFSRGGLIRNYVWWYAPPILCISLSMLGFMLLSYVNKNRQGISTN